MISFQDLKQKEVININDGKRLGFISDLIISSEDGRIDAIIVPQKGKGILSCITKTNRLAIPWENIKTIGEDTVLTDVDELILEKISE
ncbi:MAG TPA: YlmC/YmxH family sporulation protein [Clostridia bacterium]|nr:YlmC/YmxH family sporulation protein [Clostridia bacterium]